MINSIIRTIIAAANEQADILAIEQAKNKLLSLCIENGTSFKFNTPVSSQKDGHCPSHVFKNRNA